MTGFTDSTFYRMQVPDWLFPEEEPMRAKLMDRRGHTVDKEVKLDGAEHPPEIIVDNGAKKAYVRFGREGEYWHEPDIYFLRPE